MKAMLFKKTNLIILASVLSSQAVWAAILPYARETDWCKQELSKTTQEIKAARELMTSQSSKGAAESTDEMSLVITRTQNEIDRRVNYLEENCFSGVDAQQVNGVILALTQSAIDAADSEQDWLKSQTPENKVRHESTDQALEGEIKFTQDQLISVNAFWPLSTK